MALVGELDASGLDEWYDRADVFVSASLQEELRMAVAEALARGCRSAARNRWHFPILWAPMQVTGTVWKHRRRLPRHSHASSATPRYARDSQMERTITTTVAELGAGRG